MHIHLAKRRDFSPGTLNSSQALVPIDDLIPPGFIRRHTRFRDVNHMLMASGLDTDLLTEADTTSRQDWDTFARRNTTFPDWATLLQEARGEWIMRRLGIFVDA